MFSGIQIGVLDRRRRTGDGGVRASDGFTRISDDLIGDDLVSDDCIVTDDLISDDIRAAAPRPYQ
jgi:hypothetical protein